MADDPSRRDTLLATALLATGALAAGQAGAAPTGHEADWDWFVGEWSVRHRCLKVRPGGAAEWYEFPGTTSFRTIMGGLANLDDNLLMAPSGAYRAATLRAFDARDGKWRIWWLDGRAPDVLDPPVVGGFDNGVGRFVGDSVLAGKPIKLRYIWSGIGPKAARWEQAFSDDAGASWTPNWTMDFSRA